MECEEGFRSAAVDVTGTLVMAPWVMILGPMGALLLGGIAHSMLGKNLAVDVVRGAVFFLSVVLTAAWGSMRLSEFLRERRLRRVALLTAEPANSATQSLEI
jgi:hypothetical protein